MSATKFRLGDTVRVIDRRSLYWDQAGRITTVDKTATEGLPFHVTGLHPLTPLWFGPNELILCREGAAMSLPTLSVSINCGSCYGLVEGDGDGYTCYGCGLHWGTNDPFDDTPAEFLDEDATPCEHPSGDREHVDIRPFETVNGVVESWRRWVHVYAACVLPQGHASDHEFPMTTTYTEHTEKP